MFAPDSFARVDAVVSAAPGTWRIAAHFDGVPVYTREPGAQVPAASTIKLAILLAVLRAVESGRLRFSTDVDLAVRRVGESGVLADMPAVHTLPLREVLSLMITVSDNDATNAAIDVVGFAEVNAAAASLGCDQTVLARYMMDAEAAAAGRDNLTSAHDQVLLIEALTGIRGVDSLDASAPEAGAGVPAGVTAGSGAGAGASTPAASQPESADPESAQSGPEDTTSEPALTEESVRRAKGMLARQQFRDRIPALLPEGTPVLHKTGDLAGIYHDTGVVELPGGNALSLSILGSDLSAEDAHTPGDTIARISRALFQAVTN
ncbi:class A beta-lactamase-related serine hydrolase [Brevibacterium sp. 91QC2O2]|uniref:serine hydrolase n=1 Tax=Brevibacterium sp. 91QC2O2 TaxID=2968458 RepID=UPI00211BEC4D|nr:serine hydrolase [Brevibacterium sp. 91QC2O2]MCQ9368738.1 class A beta-lactamase-related serine hydrolase [Brevibacterium sp. 91QC2O2]